MQAKSHEHLDTVHPYYPCSVTTSSPSPLISSQSQDGKPCRSEQGVRGLGRGWSPHLVPTEAASDGIHICDLVRDNVALTSSAIAVRLIDRSKRSSGTIRSGLLGAIAAEGEGVQQGEIMWLSGGVQRYSDIFRQ